MFEHRFSSSDKIHQEFSGIDKKTPINSSRINASKGPFADFRIPQSIGRSKAIASEIPAFSHRRIKVARKDNVTIRAPSTKPMERTVEATKLLI